MERREPTQKALVLAGGGARGSYQEASGGL